MERESGGERETQLGENTYIDVSQAVACPSMPYLRSWCPIIIYYHEPAPERSEMGVKSTEYDQVHMYLDLAIPTHST